MSRKPKLEVYEVRVTLCVTVPADGMQSDALKAVEDLMNANADAPSVGILHGEAHTKVIHAFTEYEDGMDADEEVVARLFEQGPGEA